MRNIPNKSIWNKFINLQKLAVPMKQFHFHYLSIQCVAHHHLLRLWNNLNRHFSFHSFPPPLNRNNDTAKIKTQFSFSFVKLWEKRHTKRNTNLNLNLMNLFSVPRVHKIKQSECTFFSSPLFHCYCCCCCCALPIYGRKKKQNNPPLHVAQFVKIPSECADVWLGN